MDYISIHRIQSPFQRGRKGVVKLVSKTLSKKGEYLILSSGIHFMLSSYQQFIYK